jgi:hypothetical protein
VLKTTKKCLGDLLFEVDTRELRDYLFAQVLGERLVSDAEHIQTNAIE